MLDILATEQRIKDKVTFEECETCKYLQKRNFLKNMTCPSCGVLTCGCSHKNCDIVYGRRGWRQLGVYDG